MPRPQFTLRALLVLMFGAACFFGGMALQRQFDKPISRHRGKGSIETMTLRDGSWWVRFYKPGEPE
ncbi:MAG TPA: hypothetical protein VHC22_00675 [Pirellulales bacterium]|nr:hypothetical protein [Pirellulales bacterium]